MTEASNIQHEAEAQRQHIRIQIPATAIIHEQRYPLLDLSSGGLRIGNFDQKIKKSDILEITLRLPFQSFTLNVDLRACIEHIHTDDNELGCRFVELTTEQISILTYVIKSYMAGQVVSEGDILQVISRDNFVKMRNVATANAGEDSKTWATRIAGIIGLTIIGIAALTFIATNIFNNLAISHSEQGRAVIEQTDINAYSAGIFTDLIETGKTFVSKGEEIAEIDFSQSSDAILAGKNKDAKITIVSPCDCDIIQRHAVSGVFYDIGTPLYSLSPKKKDIWIEAIIDNRAALKLNHDMQAKFTIPGFDSVYTGRIQSITALPAIDNQLQSLIKIKPDTKLPERAINRPVRTEIWHFTNINR